MSTSVDMTAVLAKLDELYDGRGEDDPLTDYATYDRAIRAVLALHQPEPLYGECGHTDTPDDGGPASHAWEAGDGIYVCGDPTGMVCTECCDDDGSRIDFPCATYRDVAAALEVTA